MAKDFNIVFVYDTQRCQKEDDDPQDALLYFHPGWVSDQQRMALAGQLMGAAHFFLATFSCPKVLTLQRGKFVVRQFGRYILAVGTDSGTPDWLLQIQATSLESTLGFYHRDLETVAANAAASVQMASSPGEDQGNEAGSSKDPQRQSECAKELEYEQRAALVERLTQMLDVYVPVLQCASSPFSHVPTVLLPKSASNTFLEAFHILQCCQAKNGVLGGVILYQNKVVATQLSTEVTKRLVYTDPFRIKSPAESVCGAFRPPIGVQLLRVYIKSQELKRLHSMIDSAQESFSSVSSLQPTPRKVSVPKALPNKEQQTSMKRDPSRILSVLEEGEGENDLWGEGTESPKASGKHWSRASPGPASPSKVLLEQVISICKAGLAGMSSQKNSIEERVEEVKDISPVQNQYFFKERSHSLEDMKFRPFPMHHHAFGIPRHEFLRGVGSGSPQKDDLDEEFGSSAGKGSWPGLKIQNARQGKKVFNTITDPFYPVFRSDGLPISRALFDECIEMHYQALKHDKKAPELKNRKISAKKVGEKQRDVKFSMDAAKPEQVERVVGVDSGFAPTERVDRSKQEQYRRSLSLPIKSFALDGDNSSEKDDKALQRRNRAASECPGFVPTPGPEQTPLSPLLLPSGLPIPLNLEKFSRGPIPETPKDSESGSKMPGPSTILSSTAANSSKGNAIGKGDKESKLTNGDSSFGDKLEAVVLYVYGQHDMSLMLIMDDGRESDPELVHCLWEMCEEGLGGLESQLAHCLEHHQTVGGASGGGIGVGELGFSSGLGVGDLGEGGAYGFLSFDPTGETLQCGGSRPWGAPEAEVAQQLHAHFRSVPGLSEVVVRCEDYTVYGCQCCRSEVFYQQPAGNKAGLPAPSDLMGVVPLKARRRLERDYGIVLL